MASYRPMTVADLAAHLSRTTGGRIRWKLVWEFLEEYRWEPSDAQPCLLKDEPPPLGDERWDALLAALAEYLAAKHDLAPPAWAESRVTEPGSVLLDRAQIERAFTALGDRLVQRLEQAITKKRSPSSTAINASAVTVRSVSDNHTLRPISRLE